MPPHRTAAACASTAGGVSSVERKVLRRLRYIHVVLHPRVLCLNLCVTQSWGWEEEARHIYEAMCITHQHDDGEEQYEA